MHAAATTVVASTPRIKLGAPFLPSPDGTRPDATPARSRRGGTGNPAPGRRDRLRRTVEFDAFRRGAHADSASRLGPQAPRTAFGCPCGCLCARGNLLSGVAGMWKRLSVALLGAGI